MSDNKNHGVLRIRLRLVLLVMVICCSSVAVGTSLAKYVVGCSDSANARVASFIVESSGVDRADLNLNGEKSSDSCIFTVTNEKNGKVSESAIRYDVIINLPEKLNDNITPILTKDGQEIAKSAESEDGLTYTYAVGKFEAAQGAKHEFKLGFKANNDITQDFDLTGIEISVHAEQIN